MRTYIWIMQWVLLWERALPDVRDGLKPIQRRILFAMEELGNRWNCVPHKNLQNCWEVMGKFLNFMVIVCWLQDVILNYITFSFPIVILLVDGHGNFAVGSGWWSTSGHVRYTEVRLSRLAGELLRRSDKDTVDFMPNLMNHCKQPTVVQSVFLIWYWSMALLELLLFKANKDFELWASAEVIDGVIKVIDNPDITIKELNKIILGFRIFLLDHNLRLGRYSKLIRLVEVELLRELNPKLSKMNNGKQRDYKVTELPYMVNKANSNY